MWSTIDTVTTHTHTLLLWLVWKRVGILHSLFRRMWHWCPCQLSLQSPVLWKHVSDHCSLNLHSTVNPNKETPKMIIFLLWGCCFFVFFVLRKQTVMFMSLDIYNTHCLSVSVRQNPCLVTRGTMLDVLSALCTSHCAPVEGTYLRPPFATWHQWTHGTIPTCQHFPFNSACV